MTQKDPPQSGTTEAKITIGVTQAESKRVLALIAHIRRLFETVFTSEGSGQHPLQMDQSDLLLCSASLRTLFFDDSPSPILIDFLTQHAIDVEIDTFETDIAMLLFAQVGPKGPGHVCDICLGLLFDESMREYCELDQPKPLMLIVDDAAETYSDLKNHTHVWRPTKEEAMRMNTSIDFSNPERPSQLITVTRKQVPIAKWGTVRIGYLKGIPIHRKNIITYVANKLGGIHYDSKRLPTEKNDKEEFKILAQAYDWNKQAVMHAGLTIIAIACIEIVRHPQMREILIALQNFESSRRIRLLKGQVVQAF